MNIQVDSSYTLLKQRCSLDIFVCTVVISLILHAAASTVLFLPGRYSLPSVAPLFIDLQSVTSLPAVAENRLSGPSLAEIPPETAPEALPEPTPAVARMDEAIENALQKAVQTPEVLHESAIGLGMISGHFASFAQGESLKDDIRVYYFSLMRRINEVWWMGAGAKGAFISPASVHLMISRDGKVVGCELLESSGNREQDQALLDSVKNAEPLPPLPPSFRQPTFNVPIRFVPPLRLMFSGVTKKKVVSH